jgi:pilus assembly protein Flp/PilA
MDVLMQDLVRDFLHDEKGATAIEYGLIAALMAFAIISGAGKLGNAIVFLWSDNTSRLVQALD